MPERTLVELLYGKAAHANPLACIEDVSYELAGRRVDSLPHSIFQLTSHMNYWMDYELRRIRGEKPSYPLHASESWPEHPAPPSEDKWQTTMAHFRQSLSALAALAESSPEALARQIEATHASHANNTSSLLAVLWQTLVHNSYHVGQIAMLRRALGAWPPAGGGDSW